MYKHMMKAVSFFAGLFLPAVAFASDNNPDVMSFLITFLVTWGPFLLFMLVWFFLMRRFRFNQPWDKIVHHLEGIENQLGRIANSLERQNK
ncbi:MAG TPA: hypothetical protein VLY20_08000 [Nitrospiria bacterium]|nr:hypothetical protein [Nitrospiria bacterium]